MTLLEDGIGTFEEILAVFKEGVFDEGIFGEGIFERGIREFDILKLDILELVIFESAIFELAILELVILELVIPESSVLESTILELGIFKPSNFVPAILEPVLFKDLLENALPTLGFSGSLVDFLLKICWMMLLCDIVVRETIVEFLETLFCLVCCKIGVISLDIRAIAISIFLLRWFFFGTICMAVFTIGSDTDFELWCLVICT